MAGGFGVQGRTSITKGLMMSRLRLFDPSLDDEHAPAVIPFTPRLRERHSAPGNPVIRRAWLWNSNQVCPCCRRATVEPVELEDGLLNAKAEPIPGTATIVGFNCSSCGHEWATIRTMAQ
ncbi:hypothetical protein Pan44_43970 [Caulifigura coniformis]|uniref:Uncharacterized protein n=2 Tax=Caulifigura coniformis TaxID=2527983 RepID=A0A517SJP4_9PLAN|nr:hypothetical protein Pan44_43970 [Caulifigura coniformis]